ncbi:hypothetical protein GWK47_030907 [Chionoecetes opilio]|uniref:Uncharacterized protein n=1 Tax=Chionoecetes opilio TaxID=41210 RepID=A0A8J4YKL6_CHIOP|nr:hypothetical protein GWK47_030907 [Chionoecetes opilio]
MHFCGKYMCVEGEYIPCVCGSAPTHPRSTPSSTLHTAGCSKAAHQAMWGCHADNHWSGWSSIPAGAMSVSGSAGAMRVSGSSGGIRTLCKPSLCYSCCPSVGPSLGLGGPGRATQGTSDPVRRPEGNVS